MSWVAPASIQRVRDVEIEASQAAEAYFDWVDRSLPGVRVRRQDAAVHLHLWGNEPAISLRQARRDDDDVVFEIAGGFLVARAPGGEFSFTSGNRELHIALRGFTPRLPCVLYVISQALVHALVMWWFCQRVLRSTLRSAT